MATTAGDEHTRLLDLGDSDDLRRDVILPPRSFNTSVTPTPLPWRPLLVALVFSAMQPLAFEIIFPFVNQMILEIGIETDPERVGFYSGLIESIFACMSFLTVMPCSILSDRIGRKPVLLGGTLGLAASVVCFGLSKSFPAMVLSRLLGGTMGGVWACTRLVVAELTDKSNQGVAFSAQAVAHRAGQFIGLPLGGLLAHPERNFPLFRTPFWYEYPFVLPCFVAAALCLIAVTLGYFFLQETLRSKTRNEAPTIHSTVGSSTDIDSSLSSSAATPNASDSALKDTYRSILTPSIISVLCSNVSVCLCSEVIFAVSPLFMFTPISSGGLGMTEAQIGRQLGIRAVLSVVALVFYPPLEKRFDAIHVYQLATSMFPVVTLGFPLLNLLARRGATGNWIFEGCFFLFLLLWSVGGCVFTAMSVIITDSAPSAAALATLNGLSIMVIVLPQIIAPAFATSLFAASIKSGVAGGNLVWIIVAIMTSFSAIHSLTLRTPQTDWRQE